MKLARAHRSYKLMGGPIEKLIEPWGEKLLATLFPIFKDRTEVKIASVHFLTHAWLTTSLIILGFLWTPLLIVGILSIGLVLIAEYSDIKKGRWVDVYTRLAGWCWGLLPLLVRFFL